MRRLPEIILGFLIATALWSCIAIWQSQKSVPNTQAQPTKAEQQHALSGGAVADSVTHEQQGNAQRRANWYDTFLNHTPDWFVAIFTALLSFVTFRLVSTTGDLRASTDRLWEAGERQIELSRENASAQSRDMQASIKASQEAVKAAKKSADAAERSVIEADRAWIEVTIDIHGPLIFNKKSVEILAEARFKNVGKSPAINVGYELKLCADVGEASSAAADSARQAGRSFMNHLGLGQVIYPGRDASIKKTVELSRQEFIAKIRDLDSVEDKDKTEPFTSNNPALMAFVWYGLPSAGKMGKYRYSTAIFEICLIKDSYKGFDGSVATIPLDQIELVATYYSGEFA